MDDRDLPVEGYLQIDVVGKDRDLFRDLRPKLLKAIAQVLDSVVDPVKGTSLREEAEQFMSLGIEHLKARLNKAGLENEKIEAEVSKLYAEQEKTLAEARKAHGEADAAAFMHSIRKLRFVLMGTKAMLVGRTDDEALLFGKQVEDFLASLKELSEA